MYIFFILKVIRKFLSKKLYNLSVYELNVFFRKLLNIIKFFINN